MKYLSNIVGSLYNQPPRNVDMNEWFPVIGIGYVLHNGLNDNQGALMEFYLYKNYKPTISTFANSLFWTTTTAVAAQYIADKVGTNSIDLLLY